jgi:hypothetical protein
LRAGSIFSYGALRQIMVAGAHSWQRALTPSASSALAESEFDLRNTLPLRGGEQREPFTGIKALMLAVLDNGIESYLSPIPRIRAEAECWVAARSQGSPFSFAVVCETLGLEPTAVRTALRRWRAASIAPQQVPARRRPNVTRGRRIITRKTG